MNPNYNSSSSSSTDEEVDNFVAHLLLQKQQKIRRAITNNETMLQLLRDEESSQTHGDSVPGHIVINRDREEADRRLYNDYFADCPMYNEAMFRKRYRMSRSLFLRIADAVKEHDHYFQQRIDGAGRYGLSTFQKLTAVFRMLAYGLPADAMDEYCKIGESTVIESMKIFCRAIVEIFKPRYLRAPTTNDIARLLYIAEARGFPGMLGSLDCMHWKWKNCPTGWAGQFAGHSGSPSIILEAVADYDLWIWHAYFGLPGTNNYINVLERSHLFDDLTNGIAPAVHYTLNEKDFHMGYYLADGIYPKWATIVQTIHKPRTQRHKYFSMKQEACRKDVERAFGVLKQRFAIVAGPVCFWSKEVIHDIMTTCIILHNMIIEHERDLSAPVEVAIETPPPDVEMVRNQESLKDFVDRHNKIRNHAAHDELKDSVIEHLWNEYTNSKS